jgi:Na+/alanine symporter
LFYRLKKAKKMKKLAFLFAAVVAVSFASCGNKTAQTEEAADSIDTTAVVENDTTCCADTTACDSAAAPVAE